MVSVVWTSDVNVVVINVVFRGAVVGIKVVDFGVVAVVLVVGKVPWVVVVEVIVGMIVKSKKRL